MRHTANDYKEPFWLFLVLAVLMTLGYFFGPNDDISDDVGYCNEPTAQLGC